MERLSPALTENLRKALDSCKEEWIVAGVDLDGGPTILGPVGYFDWRLHGQVSRLLAREAFSRDRPCIVAGKRKLGDAKLLLVPAQSCNPSQLAKRLKNLSASSVALEESGFSKDFLAKLKDNLNKEQVKWSMLDWRIH